MFFRVKKLFLVLLLSIILPLDVIAYSDYIIASGANIGIKLNSNGIVIVGTYKINDKDPAKEAGLKVGDIIERINKTKVQNVEEMVNLINNSNTDQITIEYLRNSKKRVTTLKLDKVKYGYKTGLYVKDSVTGVGTLTFVDPETKIFGALGHEIIESSTGHILDINDGTIFDSTVTGIIKSDNGVPGEKKAIFDSSKIEGNVSKNTNKGIFGNYTGDINKEHLYKVAERKEIKKGKAKILTVLDDKNVEEYEINITELSNTDNNIKNIVFEISDKNLINKTNGIIQGMSGSPIVQGNNIIGAVTHVFVDNPLKGYGIFITNMLEEAEK